MATRRDFVRQGGWAVAGTWVPVAAQQRAEMRAEPRAEVPLDPRIVRVLMASAEAVTGTSPLRGHYESYWQHQAAYRPGRRELYQRFAAAAATAAASVGIADLASADLAQRRAILDGLRRQPDFQREFEAAVFQEILAVFQRTDAWLQLGYESWEGSARGLDDYRRAPAGSPRR